MIIRKMFQFENTHIVRGCATKRCRTSIHGHSYKVEALFESKSLDNAQMIYDFGLMKGNMQDLIESFDHSVTLWNKDDAGYIAAMKRYSDRWVELPVSPTAEQFARVIYLMVDLLLTNTVFTNGEGKITVNSIVVHETDRGYAKADSADTYSEAMGIINPNNIIFSMGVREEWGDIDLWSKILSGEQFTNPKII
ncbi:MAG: 6-carboxytetrahydropterin synthase [Campylobacteraceae bacterium]|jgi:6-pyruvoyltetrahydropterin/6-carboxytetrahydropterin synthase|nr:6-carboxytetrahydropterin synthase [Campylobacteraceae bacterium]